MPKSNKTARSNIKDGRKKSASDSKIRHILESITDMIFEADINGNITHTNRMTLRMLGYTQSDFKNGINIFDIIIADELDRIKSSISKLINSEDIEVAPGLEEYTAQRTDGSTSPITIHLNRIINETGQVTGIRGLLFDTSNDKSYKAALQISEEKLRFIVDSISDGIIVTNLEGKIVEVNNATLQKAGYTRKQEIIGQNAFEFIVQKDQQRFQKDIFETIAKRDVLDNVEYTLWAVDGKKFDAEISSALLRDNEGNPTGFIGVVRDITSRKKIEANLRSSEERLQAIVENAPDAIFIYDNEGNMIYGNRKAEELTGYSKIEFMGKNIFDMGIVTEEYVPLVIEKLKQFRGIPGGPQEVELLNKSGRRILIEVTVFPIAKQGASEVVGIARDVTERKRMEQELNGHRHNLETLIEQRTTELKSANQQLQQEITERKTAADELRSSEEKLRFMFESMDVGIIATDLEAKVIEVNDAALKMFGYKREEAIGKDGLKFIAGKDQKRLADDIKKIFKEQRNVNLRYDITHRNGKILPVELSATLLHDSNGNPTGFMSILKDITR
jgi:PAS domain S-box-containing protein